MRQDELAAKQARQGEAAAKAAKQARQGEAATRCVIFIPGGPVRPPVARSDVVPWAPRGCEGGQPHSS